MSLPPLIRRPAKINAFTLVEVAIAVGILAVSLVALLGLLPVGMTNFRKAMDISVTAQISQRLLHDMEQAEFDEVIDQRNLAPDPPSYCKPHFSFRAPKVGRPVLRYFDEQGAEVIPAAETLNDQEKRAVVYHVNIRIIPRAELPTTGETGGQVAQITVQVARNPTSRSLEIVSGSDSDPNMPERNLFKTTTGIPIYTYHALIGKNQGK